MREDHGHNEDADTPLQLPPIIEPCARESADISQNNERPTKPPIFKRLTFWNVIFNFILAITTALLGLIAYWQLDATDTANRTSMEALRVSQESYKFAKRSEEPYVTVEEVTTHGTFPSDIKLLMKIQNHGRGIAIRIVGNATIGIRPDRLESPPRFDPGGDYTIAAIPPMVGRYHWVSAQKPLDNVIIKDIQLGTRKFYVFGFLDYKDIDDNTIPRTPFCFLYNPHPARPSNIGAFDLCSF